MEVGGQRHAPAVLPPMKRTGTHCPEGWVGSGAGEEHFAPSAIRFPDLPNPSESLYELRYPGPDASYCMFIFRSGAGDDTQLYIILYNNYIIIIIIIIH